MAEKKKYNSILVSGRKDETLTYSKYVKDEESGESVKESLDKKVNVTDELTTQQIKDDAITNEKMAAGSVGNTNLQDGSVNNEKLEDGSITNEKLAENSITKDKLKDNTIGVEKLDPELRQTINAATGLPENLVETIQNIDDTLKDYQSQLEDKQSQIDDKQQQITANDEDISLLQTRSTQMEETIKNIAATGGASQATAVTYDNDKSGLTAINAQAAIDETNTKLSDLSNTLAKAPTIKDVESSSNLDISDEKGNNLARFRKGHLKTKNFDSSRIAKKNLERTLLQDIEHGAKAPTMEDVESSFDKKEIITFNIDKQAMIASVAFKKGTISEQSPKKYLTFAQITDTHSNNDCVTRASTLINSTPFSFIDLMIHTGDYQYDNPSEENYVHFQNTLKASKKPILISLGNHDKCYRAEIKDAELYEKWFKPLVDKNILSEENIKENKTYYFYDNNEYKIRFICVDIYERLLEDEVVPMAIRASKEQCEWLIDTLKDANAKGLSVIVFSHYFTCKNVKVRSCEFSDVRRTIQPNGVNNMDGYPLGDIIGAFASKGTLNETYNYTLQSLSSLPSFNINLDFSNVTSPLIMQICGHTHDDYIGNDAENTNVNIVVCNTGSYQKMWGGDINRINYGKSKDCFNVYVVDTDLKKVHIIRIGADFTIDGTYRKYINFNY